MGAEVIPGGGMSRKGRESNGERSRTGGGSDWQRVDGVVNVEWRSRAG